MALYQDYETEILTENRIDVQQDATKRDIELYDPEQKLQLPPEPLVRIQGFLDDYNRLTKNNFKLRYYQILALLFTEQFFADNEQSGSYVQKNGDGAQRMLAYWMATGSGKTLVMHLNILQYLHHFCKTGDTRLEIYLTTPLANLIKQHEREVEPYVRQLNENYNNRIELTIDTTQGLLQKEEDYFQLPDNGEIRRLILVDEAHIGLTSQKSGEFRRLRNRLNVQNSFLFEYSATFHNLAEELQEEYDKAIIYRYDYGRFYNDGYGKDHFFKSIAADKVTTDSDQEIRDNLDECFGVMAEKLQTFEHMRGDDTYDNDLTTHRPLMAFMGHTVEKLKDEGKDDEVSDIQKVLDYLASLDGAERQKFRSIFNGAITGPLVVARNPDSSSELLLSYGDGKKWGMVNVGDAAGFYNSIENERIETRTEAIEDPSLQFENLDNESSPINVLIGSRKFAEGWNSYRLSVIDLINLGSSKGNLIIQIFGRGVRLRGKGSDGKRRYASHDSDYYLLQSRTDLEANIRKLETLTVFSLRQSYLNRFLEEVHAGGISRQHVFSIQVDPQLFKVDDDTAVRFEKYQDKLPIFKQGNTTGSGIKRVMLDKTLDNRKIHYTYLDNGSQKSGTIHNWKKLTLDYRTDKAKAALDVYEDLRRNSEIYFEYLNRAKFATLIKQELEKNHIQLHRKGEPELIIDDFLSLVSEIRYHKQGQDPIAWTEQLNRQVFIDVLRNLQNRINAHINRANYRHTLLAREDFLYEYTVTKTFETQDAYDEFMEQLENQQTQIKNRLQLVLPREHRHIYKPLILPQEEVKNPYRDVKVSPDRLNVGEKKFVEDLTGYIKLHYQQDEMYEFYLMRNVQKIGIYMESDAGSYYPDFVLWVLDTHKDITHILFIDPKGEREIIAKGDYKNHPKVKLARKSHDETLAALEAQLATEQDREVCLNSFLLLRDSSELGKDQPDDWIEQNMVAHHIFRLDWHKETEDGSTGRLFQDQKSYLDLMFETVGLRK